MKKYVIISYRVGVRYMAKRGRPSKKVMKRRKELKRKSQSLLIIAVGGLILFIALSYYLITKQGI